MAEDAEYSKLRWLRRRGAVLIFVAASFWPLQIVTANVIGIVRPERVVGLVLLVVVLGLLLVGVLNLVGLDAEAAENTSFLVIVLAMSAGPILRQLGTLAYLVLVGFPILAGWLFVKLNGQVIVTVLIWGTAVALAAGPALAFIDGSQLEGGAGAIDETQFPPVTLSTKPDIFLVVFDGYPGAIAADQDQLQSGAVDIVSELSARGFQIPDSSWAAYWNTTLSIPSLMEMNYPVMHNLWRATETLQGLGEVLEGASATVETLRENGYRGVMIESGWSGASCGEYFDACVPSPWIDEAIYLILRNTIAWPLLEDSPGPYALGTLAAFGWLFDHAPELSESSTPEFVFVHVVSPHPPLRLSDDCSTSSLLKSSVASIDNLGVPSDIRDRRLIEQIDCADRLMVQLADKIDPNDIVIFVSDHGTDRRSQSDPDLVDWSRETIIERLNVFLALRLPNDCSVGDEVIVPNIIRLVLGCLSHSPIETLPERMWINPMAELEPGVVEDLLSMRAVPGRVSSYKSVGPAHYSP